MVNPLAYGGQTILSHPLFVETILPFLLVFTIVFAVLQKSKIFGENKRQIDAIVALIIGLIVISFAKATGFIVQLVPFLAVSLVVILVLMILLGSFHIGTDFRLHKSLYVILTIAVIIAVVWVALYISGAWLYIYDFLFVTGDSSMVVNIVFVGIIIAALVGAILVSKPTKP